MAGEDDHFLEFARHHGCWLIDLATEPVNHLASADRRAMVAAGIPRVSKIIRDESPTEVVVVKKSIAADVRMALERADRKPLLTVLPFPAMGWQSEFVSGLATVLRRVRRRAADPTGQVSEPSVH